MDLHCGGQVSGGLVDGSELVVVEDHEGDIAVGRGKGQHFAASPAEVRQGCVVEISHAEERLHLVCAEDQNGRGSSDGVDHVVRLLEEPSFFIFLHE